MADDPTDYQGNSKRDKEDKGKEKKQAAKEKKIDTIVSAPAVVKKKGVFRRAKDTLIEVDFKSTMAYVVVDVLIPAAKDMVYDAITNGAKHSIFGGRGRGGVMRRSYSDDRESHVIYNRGVDRGSRSMGINRYAPEPQRGSRSNRYGIDNFIIVDRQEAELVLESMADAIETYQVVSVADLNQMIGIAVRPIDHKWGWTRVDGVEVHQTREGYLIDLPEPEPI
jgi:hypothetical protein